MLNSIDKDGTGFGYDIDLVKKIINIPISGGSGKPEHFEELLKYDGAAAASDLFNFLGTGFLEVRKFLIKKNINIRSFY